ncbi:glycosyltransferase family 4 protein [Clostridium estertheticum]|uniref:glycosyltransferase family 4 protein n=1 Tax=Clostridium estertheticum TaxID=238834 RepID=UPI0013E945A1|nr:glycosyltransferase family 4 protein [Clostridium estertheticum]MBZ9689805.1 glycosyltransferase family 4 protein [Clostridium estertheticum]
MKKILNIIAQKPDKTGSGIYLQALVKEADKKGYEQAVVAGISVKDEDVYFDVKKDITFYPVMFETKELPFPVVGMSDVMPYESTRYRDLSEDILEKWKSEFSLIIDKAVKEFKPDIIICHHTWIITALVKEMYPNRNIIAFCHGTDLRQLETFRKMDSQFSKNVVKYVIYNCKNLDVVIASQRHEKNLLINQYGINEKKVRVAGPGFNPDIFYMEENKDLSTNIKIVYAGKLSYSKGVPNLINAIKLLENYHKDIELYLVGSGVGDEAKEILKICRDHTYSFNIHVLGAIHQKELGHLFRSCDILVLPSFYEGLSLVLIEAMACGLKVVVTDLPGAREWMGSSINNSGIIEYSFLPRLKDIDIPVEEDIPKFERSLSSAINKQLENKLVISEELKNAVNKKSWKSSFEDIERSF